MTVGRVHQNQGRHPCVLPWRSACCSTKESTKGCLCGVTLGDVYLLLLVTHVHEMGESHRDSPVSSESSSLQSWPLTTAVCFSVAKSCLTLCNPMGCSMSGFPVLHYLPELLKLMSIESVMPSDHLILCHPPLLLPSIFPSIRVFSSESALRIRWPKYWNFSFSNSLVNEYSGLISFRINWFDLLVVQRTLRSLL